MTIPKVLVDIPAEKGVHVKSAGAKGEKYVYIYTQYFRNADGNPRNTAKAIGKLDGESGKMIPNSNYYSMFNVQPNLPDLCVYFYGYTYLVQKCCNDMGLRECLQQSFGEQTN
ncbi:MAG: hypothetical protein LBV23_07465 [Deltaproteobacteria bacterium]|jgi:hypothetical protein|nr:hypothetical protein [Deltaproteobacteria bacterium]